MQETQTNKISRRFYIDHADNDQAIVRSVPVVVDRIARPASHQITPPEPNVISTATGERRFSRLMHTAVRRTQRKHD
jgi:hypothetical protein